MRPLDVAVIFAYFAAVIVFGLLLAGRQRDATDYFLGHRGLPWWALMLSVVATETSAVTVISVPGLAARGNLYVPAKSLLVIWSVASASLSFSSLATSKAQQDTAYQRLERTLRYRGFGARLPYFPPDACTRRLRADLRDSDSARPSWCMETPPTKPSRWESWRSAS